MATHKSQDEVEEEHLNALGPDLGPLYHHLYNEVTWLHAKWLEFRKLFAKSERRVDVLNDVAGFFFQVVQEVMWEDALLHIARLTDPPKQGGFENLTLLLLPGSISDSALAVQVQKLVDEALVKSEFARVWRNQHIAHRDLRIALGAAQQLPGASRQNVEDSLEKIAAVINTIHRHYLGGDVSFRYFFAHGDGDDLVYWLQSARRAGELKRKRFQEGRSLPEDHEAVPEA